MAKAVLIIAPGGGGKSHAIQYLNPESTFIIAPDDKELPFRGYENMYKEVIEAGVFKGGKSNLRNTKSFPEIMTLLDQISEKKTKIKVVVIDTVTHAQVESVISKLNETGYTKYTQFAVELKDLINKIRKLRSDLYVIVMAHVDIVEVGGEKKYAMKVPAGKFTRDVIDPESLFTITLGSNTVLKDGKVTGYFITNGSPYRSPEGMFDSIYIPNDLKYVISCADAYYNDKPMPESKAVKVVDASSDNF